MSVFSTFLRKEVSKKCVGVGGVQTGPDISSLCAKWLVKIPLPAMPVLPEQSLLTRSTTHATTDSPAGVVRPPTWTASLSTVTQIYKEKSEEQQKFSVHFRFTLSELELK